MYDQNGGASQQTGGQAYEEAAEELIDEEAIDAEAHGAGGSTLQYWTAPRHGKGKGRSRTDEEYCESIVCSGSVG